MKLSKGFKIFLFVVGTIIGIVVFCMLFSKQNYIYFIWGAEEDWKYEGITSENCGSIGLYIPKLKINLPIKTISCFY